jgi:hypothetical protein
MGALNRHVDLDHTLHSRTLLWHWSQQHQLVAGVVQSRRCTFHACCVTDGLRPGNALYVGRKCHVVIISLTTLSLFHCSVYHVLVLNNVVCGCGRGRREFPAAVIEVEEEWGDWLVGAKQMDAAIHHFIEAGHSTKAIEAALQCRQFSKAAGIIEFLVRRPQPPPDGPPHCVHVPLPTP